MSNVCLVDLAEAARELHRGGMTKNKVLATEILEDCSAEVERILRRTVISRGTITEYHFMGRSPGSQLRLSEWPVISISSVHEDSSRAYGASTALTKDTDYTVDEDAGILTRIHSGGALRNWATAYEAIRIIWKGGYEDPALVPGTIKAVTKQFFSTRFREVIEQRIGKPNVNDGMGNRTFMPAELTSRQIQRLGGQKNWYPVKTMTRRSVA